MTIKYFYAPANPTQVGSAFVPGAQADAEIQRRLGFKVEIQDGIVKVWARGEECRHDNWTVGPSYCTQDDLTTELLESRGITPQMLADDDGGWFCVFERNGELLRTPSFVSDGFAIACALDFVLSCE